MEENKTYDVIELQNMSIIELTSVADQFEVQIQNNFKQSLIRAILNRQYEIRHKPSELNCRDRYAVADQITTTLKSKEI